MRAPKRDIKRHPLLIGCLAMLLLPVLIMGGLALWGASLSETHTASGSEVIRAELSAVFAKQADVQGGKAWRSPLKEVRNYRAEGNGKVQWTEVWEDGEFRFAITEHELNKRIKLTLEDSEQAFFGSWTITFEEAQGGTRVTITEEGFIPNPLMRAGFHLFMQPDATLKRHLAELKAACEK